MTDVILAAHGSRDPRAAESTRALAAAVAAGRPDLRVRAAYLELAEPLLGDALAAAAGPTVVVPLLLTPAYHARIDVPAVVAAAREAGAVVHLAPILGVDPAAPAGDPDLALLVAALARLVPAPARRPALVGAGSVVGPGAVGPGSGAAGAAEIGWDAIVLGAAGSRRAPALAAVERVATALGAALGVACRPGYASGSGAPVAETVERLAATGATRIAYAPFFLAPGLLADRAADAAIASGAAAGAVALGAAPEVAELVGRRMEIARATGGFRV
jgi:sirohydrochlorin ferrochelatase